MNTHPALLRRPLAIAGAALVVAAIVTASSVSAAAAHASELSVNEARSVAIVENAHHIGIGSTTLDLAASRSAVLRALARDELANGAAASAAGTGKASGAALDALHAATTNLTRAMDNASFPVDLVFTVRAAEKSVTEQTAAWQVAEDARVAAEAAAAAAAAAAASAAAAAAADSSNDSGWTPSSSRSDGSSASTSTTTTTTTTATIAAPPPTGCGPCPGATLVQVTINGTQYWACP